jgi:hypothetical protein
MNEGHRMIELRRCRSESLFSYYDNNLENEKKSKWTIVRQRLPEILALSTTYKPTNIQTQLMLLIALMSKQENELPILNHFDLNENLSHIPTHVIVNIGGRNRVISLKRIPSGQMIHVDVDNLSFSIPTRQFIIAISRGYAHEAAAKYCPPAISDMLINLSKKKVADDRRQFKRALFKSRVGKMLFYSLFIFISGMILALIISATNTVFKLGSFDHINPNLTIPSFSSRTEMEQFQRLR